MADLPSWARYNAEIIATDCTWCGAKTPDRCRSPLGRFNGQIVVAHAARIKAAGYRWSTVLGRLEKRVA